MLLILTYMCRRTSGKYVSCWPRVLHCRFKFVKSSHWRLNAQKGICSTTRTAWFCTEQSFPMHRLPTTNHPVLPHPAGMNDWKEIPGVQETIMTGRTCALSQSYYIWWSITTWTTQKNLQWEKKATSRTPNCFAHLYWYEHFVKARHIVL